LRQRGPPRSARLRRCRAGSAAVVASNGEKQATLRRSEKPLQRPKADRDFSLIQRAGPVKRLFPGVPGLPRFVAEPSHFIFLVLPITPSLPTKTARSVRSSPEAAVRARPPGNGSRDGLLEAAPKVFAVTRFIGSGRAEKRRLAGPGPHECGHYGLPGQPLSPGCPPLRGIA